MPEKYRRKLFSSVLLVVLGTGVFTLGQFLISPKVTDLEFTLAQISQNVQIKVPKEELQIELIFTGDIMLDRGVEYQILKHDGEWRWPFLKVADELKSADILFGNLESVISDKGEKVGTIYSFRADPRVMEGLSHAGFDILSVANNHAFDYTREAFEDTFLRLRDAGIDYVGGGLNATEAGMPIIKEILGPTDSSSTKIAFLAYSNFCPYSWKATKDKSGINCAYPDNLERVKKEITDAKNQSDFLIVSIHAGEEYTQELNQFQISFSKAAIDAGADVIIGHHPHVVQKNEVYKGKYIFYSLGNFIFDQSFSTSTMHGQVVRMIIKEGKIKEVAPVDIQINSEFQPEII